MIKYRPDLVLQALDFPATALPNTVVQFSATVAERMADLGAHTDCALYVDGQQVDQANHIWVNALGVVTCRFSYKFATSGKHKVMAKAQSVLPGDYDESNNSLSGEILIANPNASLFYSAGAFEQTQIQDFIYDEYKMVTSLVPDRHMRTTTTTATQSRYFSGRIATAVNLPLKKVSYTDSTDGAALNSLSYTNLYDDFTLPVSDPTLDYTSISRLSGYDSVSGGTLTIWRYANATTGLGSTTIDVTYDAGEVTYHSDKYCKSAGTFVCVGGDYVLNPADTTTPIAGKTAPKVTFGRTYAADLVLDDGTAYSAHPTMALNPVTKNTSTPELCSPQAPALPRNCFVIGNTTVGKSGSAALAQ